MGYNKYRKKNHRRTYKKTQKAGQKYNCDVLPHKMSIQDIKDNSLCVTEFNAHDINNYQVNNVVYLDRQGDGDYNKYMIEYIKKSSAPNQKDKISMISIDEQGKIVRKSRFVRNEIWLIEDIENPRAYLVNNDKRNTRQLAKEIILRGSDAQKRTIGNVGIERMIESYLGGKLKSTRKNKKTKKQKNKKEYSISVSLPKFN